ncbi:hypothetical protein C818_02137 [Lachnospiraceae bacterium MD308]|nr:hypothetical protein C818_02137 [Lachnospiraceae bacterium MD308]
MMKAWVLHGVNDIKYENVEKPVPGKGEVLIKVSAVGICGSDIPRIYRDGAHKYPLIPGHELSGVVECAGKEVNNTWVGKRVGVFPLIPCHRCAMCQQRYYELCENYNYLGSRCNGGFAEYVSVPEWNLIELPESVEITAAAMLEPMAVAVHAMRRVEVEKDKKIAVIGMGTIGMFLVMFLKEAGFENVYAFGNKELQREIAMRFGMQNKYYCDICENDVLAWFLEHTDGSGADVIFECVGRNETCVQAISLATAFGKVVLVGNPASNMAFTKEAYWKILRKNLSIYGTWNSSFTKDGTDDWHYVLEKLSKGLVHPEMVISHRLSLDELEMGMHLMRDKTKDYIKVIKEENNEIL